MANSEYASGAVIANRYELMRELGRGGMGVVWHARDRSLSRDVAIKQVRLPDHLSAVEHEEAHARIRREAQTAAQMPHPGVITIHDILDHGASPWIVMELVAGRTLQEHLDTTGPLPPARVRALAGTLLEALHTAHQAGVVHRDVKPANILVTDDGRAILTDFGIATVDGGTALTRTGTMIGSPEYMAPERLENEQALPASDLWSLGATLYAACAGQSPFHRETVPGVITAVLTAAIPVPKSAGDLAPVITGLLTRAPQQRMTASQALEQLRRTGHTLDEPPIPPTRTMPGSVPPQQPLARPTRGHPSDDRELAPRPQSPARPPTPAPLMRPGPNSASGSSAPEHTPQMVPPDLPGTMHALRALLFLGAGWYAFHWLYALGTETIWHVGELPLTAVWFVEAVVLLALGLRASTGGGGLFATTIGVAVIQLVIVLIDVGSGYDFNYGRALIAVFVLVYVLQPPSCRFLLRNVR
ncbi:protein kinase [Lipingzhangella sp. LS1_29]|uniref:non-specific serine/threonine protein kinase n=1 Tax=Lipingzhangella rawalii TaxID=2055835 RepID=A0ABU2H5K9_9ACTN|nr:protein kinase [Lipingzhangella rawalii]MDS1270576.1 protein kinase [Lipingzhangella rawalii]